MLTRPLTLNDSEDSGRALVMHPASRLVDGGEDDDEIQTGVLAAAAPPWSSTSSSSSSPPRCASSSSSSTSSSLTLPSFFSSPAVVTSSSASHSLISSSCSSLPVPVLSPSPHSAPLPRPVAPSLFSSTLSAPSHAPSVLTPCTSSTSMFHSLSHSSPPSCLPTPPSQPSQPSHFTSTPNLCDLPPLAPPSRPPLPSALSSTTPTIFTIPAASSVSSCHSLHPSPLPSSTPPVQPRLHPPPPPPSQLYPHSDHIQPSPLAPSLASSSSVLPPVMHNSFSSAPLQPLLYQHSFAMSPPPPPTLHTPCTSQTSICPPFSSSSSAVDASPSISPSPFSLTTSSLPPLAYPPAPPPCCPCSSLLPRLLSAHRLEVRRMLRGALASLGRRLDSLERRSRRKIRKKRGMQRGGEGGAGAACSSGLLSSASLCSSTHFPTVSSSSSSSDSEDSHCPSSSLSQSQQRRRRRSGAEEEMERDRKRRRRNRGRRQIGGALEKREEDKEEEDTGRFVGRMAVSFKGGAEDAEAPLTLHNYNHKNDRDRVRGPTDQSEKAVSNVRRNGFKAPLLLHSSTSQNALRSLRSPHSGWSDGQSEALDLFPGKWHFSDDTPPTNNTFNHTDFHLWLGSSSSGYRPTLMLRLSAVAVKTMSESIRGGASEEPLRPLKDWTAPPSLSSDHCYMRTPSLSSTSSARQQLKRVSHSSKSLHLPRRRPLPLPTCPANGLSALLPPGQSAVGSEFLNANGERVKRVSQIRIRRGPPRETPLTPMGLPKAKRLKKKEFSLEEIYTNKNYKSPTSNRSLETIFEEPREKDGALLTIGYQKRRRLLLFPDFTQPRKRKKPQGVGLPVTAMPRKRAAARRCHGSRHIDDESDIDVMLVERLSALEDFLTQQGLEV